MDPLKMKVLAHEGYRMAVINNSNDFWKDTIQLKKFIETCHTTGTGMILNNLDLPMLKAITSYSADPCIIVNTDFLSNQIIEEVKKHGHLVVFEISNSDIASQNIKNLNNLVDLIGADHILISPKDVTPENLKFMQKFLKQYNDVVTDKTLQYKLTGDNFFNYAVRSLQPNN
jgi:hypothetical protein